MKFYAFGEFIYERMPEFDKALCRVTCWREDGEAQGTERIADALNAAEENRDRPWTGAGPTFEEAGRGKLLFWDDDIDS